MDRGFGFVMVATLTVVAAAAVIPGAGGACVDCDDRTWDVVVDPTAAVEHDRANADEGGPLLNVVVLPDPVVPRVGSTTVFQTFLAGASHDEIEQWRWQISGNTTNKTYSGILIHEFTEPGIHTVNLTVVHESGATANRTLRLKVRENDPPFVDFDHAPASVTVGDEVRFSGMPSNDPDGWVRNMTWFIDGQPHPEYVGEDVSHTFSWPGEHTVTLVVVDDAGNIATKEGTVNVGGDLFEQLKLLVDEFWLSLVSFLIGATGAVAGCYRRWA